MSKDYPVTIITVSYLFLSFHSVYSNSLQNKTWNGYRVLDGKFQSPLVTYMPDVVPPEVAECYFQIIIPKSWNSQNYRPMCIHFAGTGDHVRFCFFQLSIFINCILVFLET